VPTILVADDAFTDRALVSGLLTKAMNCKVIDAPDGQAALALIETEQPDLVLTDLHMPGMNGLQLVAAVKDQFPLIPVILMTAKGSEEIAAEAMCKGAASYVPKRRLAEDLMRTVVRVLSVARENRVGAQLMHYMDSSEGNFTLHNDPPLMHSLVSYLQQVLRSLPLGDETERLRVGIALEAALSNALYHGKLEIGATVGKIDRQRYDELFQERFYEAPYCDRRIHVTARVSRERAEFVIRDDGVGFDTSRLGEEVTAVDAESTAGQGIILMRTIMDEVGFNEAGNQVTLTKLKFEDDFDDESLAHES
jgi:CheY-like chemotaxis protein